MAHLNDIDFRCRLDNLLAEIIGSKLEKNGRAFSYKLKYYPSQFFKLSLYNIIYLKTFDTKNDRICTQDKRSL